MTRKRSFPQRITALQRLAFAIGAALCAFGVQATLPVAGSTFLISWDVGTTTYLALAWTTILTSDPKETRLHARNQDLGAYVISVTVLVAAFASVAAITLLLLGAKD